GAIRKTDPTSWRACKSTVRCIAAVCFFACKHNRLASKPTHDHKKHWNAVARDLSDSCRNHYTLSRRHRSNRDGNCGAHSGHFDFDWQIVKRLQPAELKDKGAQR